MSSTSKSDTAPVLATLELLERRLRSISTHSLEDPTHDQEVETLRDAFDGLWQQLSALPLTVTEDGLCGKGTSSCRLERQKDWPSFTRRIQTLRSSIGQSFASSATPRACGSMIRLSWTWPKPHQTGRSSAPSSR